MNNVNMDVDSWEERYFLWYLETLRNWNYIKHYDRAETFPLTRSITRLYNKPLKTKVKIVSEEVMKPHHYTPDFVIQWKEQALGIFTAELNGNERRNLPFISKGLESIVEVKPSFDAHNMTRAAMINIKWVFEKYGNYVNIIKPEQLFNKTFTPERYLLTNKSMKPRTIKYKNVRNIKQFIQSIHQ